MKYFLPFALISLFVLSCERELKPVDVEITDPKRHYYPVIQGELLGITYEIENMSKDPLFIQEIQTTCGCMVPQDKLPIVIPPKQKGKVHLTYNSTKNTGYVEHFAWLYGNFSDSTWRELQFDTNVVPPVNYTPDYEELWHQVETKSPNMKDLVDGKSTEKGYYTDEWLDPREENREEIQDQVNDLLGR
ncbi:MAG: DUF1573 domain-containing protein [Muribaculaceae bacterium]|nr:DUF1573 domain-containing protein [Muribaculaceae bacterium]